MRYIVQQYVITYALIMTIIIILLLLVIVVSYRNYRKLHDELDSKNRYIHFLHQTLLNTHLPFIKAMQETYEKRITELKEQIDKQKTHL